MALLVRDPSSKEEKEFLHAVKRREEETFIDVVFKYHDVLWASVYSDMSEEDKEWVTAVCKKIVIDKNSVPKHDDEGW